MMAFPGDPKAEFSTLMTAGIGIIDWCLSIRGTQSTIISLFINYRSSLYRVLSKKITSLSGTLFPSLPLGGGSERMGKAVGGQTIPGRTQQYSVTNTTFLTMVSGIQHQPLSHLL